MTELVGVQTTYRPNDLSRIRKFPVPVLPELLRTCKKVHEEAAPILYGKNAFYLSLPDLSTRGQLATTEPAEELRLRSQCLWLFGYRAENWHKLFFEIQASLFARFLYKIGKANAARITTVRILVDDPLEGAGRSGPMIGQAMNVVCHLLHRHVPGLRDLSIVLMVDDLMLYSTLFRFMDYKEPNNDGDRPYRTSWNPYPSVELVLYQIMQDFIPKLSGLKRLRFQGFGRDPFIKKELEKLEVGGVTETEDKNVETV